MAGCALYAAAPSQLTARLIQPTKKTPLLNSVQHNALALDIKASPTMPVCLVNEGFGGINAVRGRCYRLSFWAKTLKYQGTVKATLCSKDGSQLYAETVVSQRRYGREHARYTHCHPSCGATALTREWQHSAGCTSLLAEYRQDQVSSSKEGSGVV